MLHTFALLPADTVRDMRTLLDTAPWVDGRGTAGAQAAQVKRNEQLDPVAEPARRLRRIVLGALDSSPEFLAAALPRKVFPPRFNRYGGTLDRYGPHVDGAIRFGDGGARVRTDLSCTVFLSEPHAYDGGELCIRTPAGEQRVKLPAGHAVLYPGTHVHEVTPVTRGHRLAAFFWVESLVRGAEQRAVLWELDRALTALRARHGESDETVALTGTYHNLLRLWADT